MSKPKPVRLDNLEPKENHIGICANIGGDLYGIQFHMGEHDPNIVVYAVLDAFNKYKDGKSGEGSKK